MQISCCADFPGFSEWTKLMMQNVTPTVYLNGEKQSHCIAADDQRGVVVRYVLDRDKRPVIDPATINLRIETLRGRVRIEMAKVHDPVRNWGRR